MKGREKKRDGENRTPHFLNVNNVIIMFHDRSVMKLTTLISKAVARIL